jgi:hypothetical protein
MAYTAALHRMDAFFRRGDTTHAPIEPPRFDQSTASNVERSVASQPPLDTADQQLEQSGFNFHGFCGRRRIDT